VSLCRLPGNCIVMSFIFSEVTRYVHRSSDFVCTVFEYTFSRIRISAYIMSSASLADKVISLPVMIYPRSILRQRDLFGKLGVPGYTVDIVYVNCCLSVGNDDESDFTRFGTCVESHSWHPCSINSGWLYRVYFLISSAVWKVTSVTESMIGHTDSLPVDSHCSNHLGPRISI
jgi:hypothetical protein